MVVQKLCLTFALSSILQVIHGHDIGVIRVIMGECLWVIDSTNGTQILPFNPSDVVTQILAADI